MDLGILRVLLVRHGMSEDNQNAIWAGHKDSPLTSTGISQAKALGAILANYSIQGIYTSDLKRASSTAEAILASNRSIPPPLLVQTQSLREQNFGLAEGKNWNGGELANMTAKMAGEDSRQFKFPEGESLADVNARMGASLRRYVLPRLEALRTGNEKSEPQVVIVAHGIAIAEMLRVLINLHDPNDKAPWPDPRETYKRVRLENTGWTLVELAVPLIETSEIIDGTQRKPVYVRIVQQNVIDHLKGPLLPSSMQQTAAPLNGGASATVGNLLGGGSGTSTTPSLESSNAIVSANDPVCSPSIAFSSLRPVNPQSLRDIERSGTFSSIVGSLDGMSGSTLNVTGNLVPSPALSTPNIPIPSATMISGSGAWNDLWTTICQQIFILFANEELRTSIEEVNDSVSEHVRRCLERSPARASDALMRDLYAISAAGMSLLNAKLDQIPANEDVRFLEGLVDLWKRFHWRILPYLEACFLPLQTNATLVSLSRAGDNPNSTLRTEPIDISRIVLNSFRDQIMLSRTERLLNLFGRMEEMEAKHMVMVSNGMTKIRSNDDIDEYIGNDEELNDEESQQIYPRLAQMVHITYSAQTQNDKQEMDGLVRALRNGHEGKNHSLNGRKATGVAGIGLGNSSLTGASSELHGGSRNAKRAQARQGWLPKSTPKNSDNVTNSALTGTSGERNLHLPNSASVAGVEKDENLFLSSLRSPVMVAQDESSPADLIRQEGNGNMHLDDEISSPKGNSSRGEPSEIYEAGGGRANFIDDELEDLSANQSTSQSQSGYYEDASMRSQESRNVGLGLPMDQLNDTTFG